MKNVVGAVSFVRITATVAELHSARLIVFATTPHNDMRCDAACCISKLELAQRKGSSFHAATLTEGTAHFNESKHNIER